MPPLPIAMCGKITPHALAFTKLMLPEYDVVFRFQSVQEFHSSFPRLIHGEPVDPETKIGTNTGNPSPKIPPALFVGGGFSPAEFAEMLAHPDAKKVPFVTPGQAVREEVRGQGDLMSQQQREQGPEQGVMEVVVRRVKECLRSHGVVEGWRGVGEGEGGVVWEC